MIKVDQQVICIDADWQDAYTHLIPVLPKKDNIYTVRSIIKNEKGVVGLRFYELPNPNFDWADGIYEPGFNIRCFKPLSKMKFLTDISIFKRMLNKVQA